MRGQPTPADMAILAAISAAADAGEPCPNTDTLCGLIGCESNSTPAEGLVRLERAGLITVTRYLKHRVVTIVATGRSTAEPANPKRHWRERPLGMASAALKLADIGEPGASDAIRSLSASRGLAVPDLVSEIMRRGWRAVREDGGIAA